MRLVGGKDSFIGKPVFFRRTTFRRFDDAAKCRSRLFSTAHNKVWPYKLIFYTKRLLRVCAQQMLNMSWRATSVAGLWRLLEWKL